MCQPILAALFIALAMSCLPAGAQDVAADTESAVEFDTSYQASAAVTYRVQRSFLDSVLRSQGADARAALQGQFESKDHTQLWQELVERYGLRTGDVADALAAYWILNWAIANGAYEQDIQAGPVKRQLALALSQDPGFGTLSNNQRQEMAERLMLDFLTLASAADAAVAERDMRALQRLAQEAASAFKARMGVDLLTLEPGPQGLVPKRDGD